VNNGSGPTRCSEGFREICSYLRSLHSPNSLGPTSLDIWRVFGGQAAHPNSLGPTSLELPARILGSSGQPQLTRPYFARP
jgi:hypothetical protein